MTAMHKIAIAGLLYRVHSPSLFELDRIPGPQGVWLAFDPGDLSRHGPEGGGSPGEWLIAVRGVWGAKSFRTRRAAAAIVWRGFQEPFETAEGEETP